MPRLFKHKRYWFYLVLLCVLGVYPAWVKVSGHFRYEAAVAHWRALGGSTDGAVIAPPRSAAAVEAAGVYDQIAAEVGDIDERLVDDWIAGLPEEMASAGVVWSRPMVYRQRIARLLPAYEGPLSRLHVATMQPIALRRVDYGDGVSALLPSLGGTRRLAWLLIHEAVVAADAGDWDAAHASLRAVLRLADHVAAEPQLVGQIVAYTLDSSVARTAANLLGPTDGVDMALADALRAKNYVPGMIDALLMEGTVMIHHYERGDFSQYDQRVPADPWQRALVWYQGDARMAGYLDWMSRRIEALRATGRPPYAGSTPSYETAPMGMLSPWLDLAYGQALAHMARVTAERQALWLTMKLRQYKQRHGTYPATLAALRVEQREMVNAYTGERFDYQTTDEGFVIELAPADDEPAASWRVWRVWRLER